MCRSLRLLLCDWSQKHPGAYVLTEHKPFWDSNCHNESDGQGEKLLPESSLDARRPNTRAHTHTARCTDISSFYFIHFCNVSFVCVCVCVRAASDEDEVCGRGGRRLVHRELLQHLQCPAHIRVPAHRSLRGESVRRRQTREGQRSGGGGPSDERIPAVRTFASASFVLICVGCSSIIHGPTLTW